MTSPEHPTDPEVTKSWFAESPRIQSFRRKDTFAAINWLRLVTALFYIIASMFAALACNKFTCWILIVSSVVEFFIVLVQTSALDRYATLTAGMVIGSAFTVMEVFLALVLTDHYVRVKPILALHIVSVGAVSAASYSRNMLICLCLTGFGVITSVSANIVTGGLIRCEVSRILKDYTLKLKKKVPESRN